MPSHKQISHLEGRGVSQTDTGCQVSDIIEPDPGPRNAGLVPGILTVTPEYLRTFEETFSGAIAPTIDRHKKAASEALRPSSIAWHESRARGLKTSPLRKRCEFGRFVHCGCSAFAIGGCRSKTCQRCSARKWGAVRRRALAALERHGKHGWRMMTLGGPAQESPRESIRAIQAAWARLRARLFKHFGQSFPFLACLEFGRKRGHVHLHVICKWPHKWLAYPTIGHWWSLAFPGAGAQGCDFAKDKRGQSVMNADNAAKYAAKYASKGTELLTLPAKTAAEILAGLVGARMVRASQGFWVRTVNQCAKCHEAWRLAERTDVLWCESFVRGRARHSHKLRPRPSPRFIGPRIHAWDRERLPSGDARFELVLETKGTIYRAAQIAEREYQKQQQKGMMT